MTNLNNLTEEQMEARENAIDVAENHIWQCDQRQPLTLVKDLIEWCNNCTFEDLESWSSNEIDNLAEKLEDLGIWISRSVNPFAESQQWNDVLIPLIKRGRTAKISATIQVAKKHQVWSKVIDLFTKARAEIEVQKLEASLEPDYE